MKKHSIAILLSLIVLTLHLFFIGKVGLGDSEAYYYSWSKNLDLSYYDHPAGIAILIRIATLLFGDTPFAIRFFSSLMAAITLLLVYAISYSFYRNERLALYSILFLISTPAFLIGGVAAAPEPPLVLFSTLSAIFFYRYYTNGLKKDILYSFVLLGIAFNIKYSALFILITYLIILYKERRFSDSDIIKSIILFSLFLIPVIVWNIIHRGASFEYHILKRVNLLYIPINLLKLIGGQILYFNPIIIILIAVIVVRQLTEIKNNIFFRIFSYIFILSAIPMLIIQDSEPHWSAPAYIFAAIGFADEFIKRKRLVLYALSFNLILFGVFIFHLINPLFTETILAKQNPKYDITNELFGWDIVGENIEYIVPSEGIKPKDVLLASNHYTMSSQLMFATRGKYRVICRGKRCNQFTINDVKDESAYQLIVFITDNRFTYIPHYYRDAAVEQKLKIRRGEKVIREFHIFIKRNLK